MKSQIDRSHGDTEAQHLSPPSRRSVQTKTTPAVFIIDDNEAARRSVAMLVEPMNVPAEPFSSAEEFLAEVTHERRGCVVTDVRMPGISGLELQEELAANGFELPIIVISAYANVPMGVRAMKSGAVTVLEKPCRDEELWDAIREALALDAQRHQRATRRQEIKQRLASLSQKERDVMDLLLIGQAHKQIASKLDVSKRTIEGRRKHILEKTQTKTLVELAGLVAEVAVDGQVPDQRRT